MTLAITALTRARRLCVALVLVLATLADAAPAPAPAPAPKVLRIASESETGFDPARVGDARSFRVIAHIFETLLRYDPLARPVKLKPGTAAALPEPSADFRSWTAGFGVKSCFLPPKSSSPCPES